MASNLDVITDALRLLNVINEIQVPSASQAASGLTVLNDMMADWEEDGIELGYYPQTSQSATIPIQDQYLRGVKHNLAVALAPFYGASLTPEAAVIADRTKARLVKDTVEVVESSLDHLPIGEGRNVYDINSE